MNTSTVATLKRALAELQSERTALDGAIANLERLIGGAPKANPGRKLVAARAPKAAKVVSRSKPKWSSAARKAAAARMKKYWADRRKQQTAK